MTMLDGLKPVFLEALSFADERTRAALVEKWSLECQAVYEYKKQLIAEEHYKAAHNKTEWISVDERLPEGKSPIIVTDGEKVIVAYENWLYRSNSTGKLRCPANYGSGMDVTHWMPLPDAPKGGEG